MRIHSDPSVSEQRMLRQRLHALERAEIVRQREAIVYLEGRVEELMRNRRPVAVALGMLDVGDTQGAREVLGKVLEGWLST